MDNNLDDKSLNQNILNDNDNPNKEPEDILDLSNDDLDKKDQKASNNILDIDSDLALDRKVKNNNIDDRHLTSGSSSKSWLWIGGISLVVLLLGATVYFVLSQISFNKGLINFTFDPQGVDITIDEEFNEQAIDSLSIKLKSGTHRLRVTKDGYLNIEREFYLSPGEDSNMHIELETIPDIELVLDESVSFAGLANNGKTFVYMDDSGFFGAVSLDLNLDNIKLFEGDFSNIQEVIWSPGEPKAIVKIKEYPHLVDTYDNRNVKGRYIPLGESPMQGAPYRNGFSTWLFDDSRRMAKGWQPVLLNESIRYVTFSPNGRQIMYFYETADGEKSLIVANPDGVDWERVITQVDLASPKLKWLNDEQFILVFDDSNKKDKLFDNVSRDFIEIMPDRVANTKVISSPNGTKILYLADIDSNQKLAIWDIASGSRDYVLEENILAYTWKTDNEIILIKSDQTLWYWNFYNNSIQPIQFISSLGDIKPVDIIYSAMSQILYIKEGSRVLSLLVY